MADNSILEWNESANPPTMCPKPYWLAMLLEDCEEHDETWAVKLLPTLARIVLWNVSAALGVRANGVPGQACRLMERYLSAEIRRSLSGPMGSVDWETLKASLSSRLLLLMASCIQLATKMSCADVEINATVIRTCLGCRGQLFTVKEINESELRVFSTLGFRLPLWTSVEAGELLAVDAGLPIEKVWLVAKVVDTAEFLRNLVDHHVRQAVHSEPSCSKFRRASVRKLHLVAGAVAACARVLALRDAAPHLADRTQAPLSYIRCVSDVILHEILVKDENTRKRTANNTEVADVSPWKRKKD